MTKPKLISFLVVAGTVAVIAVCFFIDYAFLATPRAVNHIEALGGSVVHDTAWGGTVYERISLNDTKATDADLEYVRRLWPCSGVYLRNTNVTDDGLLYLHGLPLYEIDLTGTKVTREGVEELRATIPIGDCQIEY